MSGSSQSLDLTIVSAKNLKNVNRLNGDLIPYVVAYFDPNHIVSTKHSSTSTGPLWNERFLLSLPTTPPPFILTLEIFHADTTFVGSVEIPIPLHAVEIPASNQTFIVVRPSGRPRGTIELRLALVPRPMQNYQICPPSADFPFRTMPPQQSYPPPTLVSYMRPQQYYPTPLPGPTNVMGSLPPQQYYPNPLPGPTNTMDPQQYYCTSLPETSNIMGSLPPQQYYPTPPLRPSNIMGSLPHQQYYPTNIMGSLPHQQYYPTPPQGPSNIMGSLPPPQYYPTSPPGPSNIMGSLPPHQYYPTPPPRPTNVMSSLPAQQFDSHYDPHCGFCQSYYPTKPYANPALVPQGNNDGTKENDSGSTSDSSED